jgi:hypothetical protein
MRFLNILHCKKEGISSFSKPLIKAKIPFEAKKDSALIFNNLIRKNIYNFAQYIEVNPRIIALLCEGYSKSESALNCGSILRESNKNIECLYLCCLLEICLVLYSLLHKMETAPEFAESLANLKLYRTL